MKILFCSPFELDRKRGAAQTVMVLADELEKLGARCTLVGPAQVGATQDDYPDKLHAYLSEHAHEYDVVEFDYKRLAFERADFSRETLFVARCQLLLHLYETVRIPPEPTMRGRLRALLLAQRDRRRMKARIRRATATVQAADLVIVLNKEARAVLMKHGLPEARIRIMPNGMTEAQFEVFDAVPVAPPEEAVVGFIGMYGPRKGAADFPALARRVAEAVPEVRFRLMGTWGRFKTEEAVLALFPPALRKHVEVIPRYDPETVADLLAPCAVGVFPSYLEGFPLGVLEMLAAALPVVAYDAPGAPEMLPPGYLTPPGDVETMSRKVIHLLQDREALAEARRWARQHVQQFRWQHIAQTLAATYEEALAQKRAGRK